MQKPNQQTTTPKNITIQCLLFSVVPLYFQYLRLDTQKGRLTVFKAYFALVPHKIENPKSHQAMWIDFISLNFGVSLAFEYLQREDRSGSYL